MTDIKFKTKVNELIKDEVQKEKMFDALRIYQTGQDLSKLLMDMQAILDEPNKLELFDHMRPLVLLHHQVEYSQRMPSVPGVKARIVRLHRTPHEGLGFAVRGGLEHGVGVFVTDVKSGSQADRQGLRIGDEIIGVNGFTISEAIHDDVLSLIKARDDIVLKVTHIGMLPMKENASEEISWKYVEAKIEDDARKQPNLKIFIDSSGHHSLGCGILSGPHYLPGIFVEKVRPGSIAEEVNLEPGDQIVEVNGTVFNNITHKEAVLALVSSRQLHLTIRKGVGKNLMEQIPNLGSSYKSQSTRSDGSSVHSHGESSTHSHQDEHRSERNAGTVTPATHQTAGNQNSSNSFAESRPLSNVSASEKEPRPSPTLSLLRTQAEVYSEKASPSPSTSPSPPSSLHSLSDDVPEQRTTREVDRDSGLELREEIRSRIGSNHSSPISGAEAILQQRRLTNTSMPGLLGWGDDDFQYNDNLDNKIYNKFSTKELDGRALVSLVYNKKSDLGVTLEGGLGSPLDGKIVVAMLFDDGVAKRSGKMKMGDQLMSINGIKLIDVTVTKAYSIIQDQTAISQVMVELIFCASTLVNEEESITYF